MKKLVVTIIVYNRTHNVEKWIHCWKQCVKTELVVIDNGESASVRDLCAGIAIYIPRKNVGFDIGAFQDVCRRRLNGFPDYDYLLWCTDDTFPMSPDFTKPFLEQISKPYVGIACMKISTSVQPHVRTTGFCIKREIAERLKFPADPITTKSECYLFEHRGAETLTTQVRKLGLNVEQVARDRVSPMWDSGYWKRLDRQSEFEREFNLKVKQKDKVTFICTVFKTYPQIISALKLQTHQNWELILIHDGQCEDGYFELVSSLSGGDERITFTESIDRVGNWGHALRQQALQTNDLGNYVVITNADNYYVPTFIEYMLKGFLKSHTAVATYCEKMTHSYKAWDVIQCRTERGYLDCGGVMVRSEVAKEVGWSNTTEHSADWVYFSEIAQRYSWKNFIQVRGNLFVHN